MKVISIRTFGIAFCLIAAAISLSGCSMQKQLIDTKATSPLAIAEVPPAPPAQPKGFAPDSLWNDQLPFGSLYSDPRASGINDIITVQIVENASAENSASTSSGKKSEISAGVPTMLGFEAELASKVTRGFNPSTLMSANLDKSFDANGKTARSGTLIATVSARVVEVLPNGNLRILGQREISLNNEKETIFVSGIIRRGDIQADNTILSVKIADARIRYGGKGHISEEQRAGWAGRIVSVLWPF
ncbi:flagellar basal body L-ring protein FlgH [bacterium]|nr:flagellar basal body L-ring protein FlgH [bacterium]